MNLLNYTNRPILFVHKNGLRTLGNGRFQVDNERDLDPIYTLERAGAPLRVQMHTDTVALSFGISEIREVLMGADELPAGDDILLVSKQYAEACRKLCRPTARLRICCGAVYMPGMAFPIASTGIMRVEGCLPYQLPNLFNGVSRTEDDAAEYIRSHQAHTLSVVDSFEEWNRGVNKLSDLKTNPAKTTGDHFPDLTY